MSKTTFTWDPVSDVVLTEESPISTKTYTCESTHPHLVSQMDNQTLMFHYDARGDVQSVTNSDEQIVAAVKYDAWGAVLTQSGDMGGISFAFCGEYGYLHEPICDNYYVRRRFYQPATARWMSKDPAHLIDGTNQYLYTKNSPIGYVDPSGLARVQQIKDGSLVYSCNCGWIDWTHAGGGFEKWRKEPDEYAWHSSPFAKIWRKIQTATKYTKVCYTQQQSMGSYVSSGTTTCFTFTPPLSDKFKECLAWQIFRTVSERFERHQGVLGKPWNPSGFSSEDMVSDLIHWHRTVRGLSKAEIEEICDVQSDKNKLIRVFKGFNWDRRACFWNTYWTAKHPDCPEKNASSWMLPRKLQTISTSCGEFMKAKGKVWGQNRTKDWLNVGPVKGTGISYW